MIRQARLRPEYAQYYPMLTPGVWDSAAVLSEKVVASRLLQPQSGFLLSDRVLPEAHFEFRGGVPRAEVARLRQTDGEERRALALDAQT